MIYKNYYLEYNFSKQYFFVFHVSYLLAFQLQQMKKQPSNFGINKSLFFKDDVAAFVHYFAALNSEGLANILKDDVVYDELYKQDWIRLFETQFDSFRGNTIHHLEPIPGICSGCKKGCSGYTFLDEVNGFYVDLAIEVTEHGNIDFMDCVNLKNIIEVANKKEQIFIKPIPYHDCDEVPF